MSLSPYPAYKDSGVEWLPPLPSHWCMHRFKQIFVEREERSILGDELLLSVSSYTGITPKSDHVEDGEHLSRAESLEGYKVCYPDDLVMNIMLAWNRGLGFSRHHGIVSPAYSVYRLKSRNHPKYLDYLVRSDEYTIYFKAFSAGVIDSRLRLYPDSFGALYCSLPPIDEQERIARFLDAETLKIDGLIEEQEKLIALLKEKRQAVVSHAVTKGLNPSVPMKDSGIEWLGEVPAHWGVTRLKYATKIIVDCPHETPIYDDEGEYYVIRTADIDDGSIESIGMYRVREDQYLNRTRRQILLAEDIVYGREGERWGHAALVPFSEKYCLGQRMMQFRASSTFSPGFLMWQLNSINIYRQGEVDTVGATSPHVNVGTIRNFGLTSPPKHEQDAISSYLSEQSGRINTLISEAQRAIALLAEYRSALVSAAVTGKIDVRQLAAAEAA